MAKLIYSAITSLDGYVADADGNFELLAPDPELHQFINDQERPIGTYLYGRRLYEVMVYWESVDAADAAPVSADFAGLWRAADKIVYSSTLDAPTSARTRIERTFDPETISAMKASADRDISIGGPHLAAAAIKAGLVDECHLFVSPVSLGGGNAALPHGVVWPLRLVGFHQFGSGVVHLHYRPR